MGIRERLVLAVAEGDSEVSNDSILQLFKNSVPNDDEIHQLAADHKLTPDQLEDRIYELFHKSLQGTAPQTASVLELALVKGIDSYEFFDFTGEGISIKNAKGRSLTLAKGETFGVRKSANGKDIRLITEADGPSIIFTLDAATAQFLGAKCKASSKHIGGE